MRLQINKHKYLLFFMGILLLFLPSILFFPIIPSKTEDLSNPNMGYLTDEYYIGYIKPGIQTELGEVEEDGDLITEWNNANSPPHWSRLDEYPDTKDGGNIRENTLGNIDKWRFTSLDLEENEHVTKLVYFALMKEQNKHTSTYADIDTSVSTAGYWSAYGVEDTTEYEWYSYTVSGLWLNENDLDGFWLQVKVGDMSPWMEGYNPGWIDINNVYVKVYVKKELDLTIESPQEGLFHTTRGHYLGSYTFENDDIGENPSGWIIDESGGKISVKSRFLGHANYVEMQRTSGSHTMKMLKTFSYRLSGTIEFYILPSLEANYDIIIGEGNTLSGYLQLRFAQNGYLKYYDGSWHDIDFNYKQYFSTEIYHWFHIKIVFGCDYPFFQMGSWNLYVDGVRLDPPGGFDFVDFTPYLDRIEFNLPTDHANKILLVDAIGFSWDSQYSVGDNLKEGLYLKFTGAESSTWCGYSLDGEPTITIPGNTLIPMPTYGGHTIQVFGEDSSGFDYESEVRNFFNYYFHNDEDEVINWGVDLIDAERVWGGTEDALDIDQGCPNGSNVNVLVIDNGFDYNHPDLNDNYKGGYDEFNDGPLLISKVNGHGTLCAGIIGAEDNGIGFIGVAPKANLYLYKITSDYGIPSQNDALKDAIKRAKDTHYDEDLDNDIDIISISWKWADTSELRNVCSDAYDNDIIIVAAAGNEDTGTLKYPAGYEDYVIPVGASDFNNQKADMSNWGYSSGEGIVAPGLNIGSTWITDDYAGGISDYNFWNGTSFATPLVAGTCALILSAVPSLRTSYVTYEFARLTDIIKHILYTTAIPYGEWDNKIGNGVLNASRAVSYALDEFQS